MPYDGSKQSDKAFEIAAELAARLKDARIVLVHVVGSFPTPIGFDRSLRSMKTGRAITMAEHIKEIFEALEENATAMLENKKKSASARGFVINTVVQHGKPADEIVKYASKEGMDLMIIGNVGAGTKFKIIKFLGSVSRAVSEKAFCPVMIVH